MMKILQLQNQSKNMQLAKEEELKLEKAEFEEIVVATILQKELLKYTIKKRTQKK